MVRRNKKIKDGLKPLVKSLKEGLGRNLIAVVLFGSRARGGAGVASDWDIMVLARSLPSSPMKRHRCLRQLCNQDLQGGVSFLAKTQREFEDGFPSFYLDLALDGVVLYDTDGYMQAKLRCINEIIEEAGLKRSKILGGFFWVWKKPPETAEWEIGWKGFEMSRP